MLSKTWREEAREYRESSEGHLFIGGGWAENSRGVAILMRAKWKGSVTDVNYGNERVLAIDLQSRSLKLRIVSVSSNSSRETLSMWASSFVEFSASNAPFTDGALY